ncbi:hypothetical protein QN277_015952 [Acacia crassicarpa]|uniref:Uncharacterized protein n=1 Tax=Acacia crassicarpa TaxID=499986 RepID=A0AAE1K1S6_9FABA|nr:hypothetical protein QN277_015952 [Acacia crassicarpa]
MPTPSPAKSRSSVSPSGTNSRSLRSAVRVRPGDSSKHQSRRSIKILGFDSSIIADFLQSLLC